MNGQRRARAGGQGGVSVADRHCARTGDVVEGTSPRPEQATNVLRRRIGTVAAGYCRAGVDRLCVGTGITRHAPHVSGARHAAAQNAHVVKVSAIAGQRTDIVVASDGRSTEGHVSHRARDPAEQAQVIRGGCRNFQPGDGVSQPVELAAESGGVIANGCEAGVAVPGRCAGGVNVRAQHEGTGHALGHALQGGACWGYGGVSGYAQAAHDGVVDRRSVAAKLGRKTARACDVDRRVDGEQSCIACSQSALTVKHGQTCRAGKRHGLVHRHVVVRVQGQGVGVPVHPVVDQDVAHRTSHRSKINGRGICACSGLDRDAVAAQQSAQLGASHVATGCGHSEVSRIDQPLACRALLGLGFDLCCVAHFQRVPRGLNLSAAARASTFGLNAAIDLRDAVFVAHIAPQHHLAAIALPCGNGLDACALRHRHLHSLARVATALPVSAHQNRAAAHRAIGFDAAGARQRDAVGHQDDLAALLAQARGAELPTVLDHRALQRSQRVGRQNDLPAFGQHGTAVLHQGRDGLRRGGDACQARATVVEVERDGFARGQRHGARLGHNHALVAHLGGEQGDVAACCRRELAFVDHAACAACAVEAGLARHELVGVGLAGGGHQAAHVDLRRGREIHPVGVTQEHLPVGTDLAVDLVGVIAQDVVERDRAAAGLVELHLGLAADVEAGPVDDGALAALVHAHERVACGCGARVDVGVAASDHTALGQLVGCGCGDGWRGLLRVGQAGHAAQRHAGQGGCDGLGQGFAGA